MIRLKALYNNLRLKHKLFVLIFVIMMLFGLLGTILVQYAFHVYDKEIYQQSSKALSLTTFSFENELKRMERLSFIIATDTIIQEHLRTIKSGGSEYDNYVIRTIIRERMVSLGALDKYVSSIQLYDVFDTEYSVGASTLSMAKEKLQELQQATSLNMGGNTWISPDSADNALAAAREVRSYEQLQLDYLGTLAVRIDINKLFNDLAQSFHQQNANLVIMQNGQALYPEGSESPLPLHLLENLKGEQGWEILSYDGKKYFASYMDSLAYSEWSYFTLIPYDNIFYRTLQVKNWLFLAFAFLMAVVLLLVMRFSKNITQPIERLSTRMKRVQQGHFDYEEDPSEKNLSMDEVGQIHRNFRMMVERINELIHENYVKQLTIRDTELKALQAQINPHFLYNTLESINWSAKLNKQTHISRMVEALGSLLRTSISLKDPLITLSKELQIVGYYVTIQRYRFEERLDFLVDIPEALQSQRLPKLSLQPLVENAVNYALEQMIDTCRIELKAYVDQDRIYISVADNGPGIDPDLVAKLMNGTVQTKGSGLGLKNIDERIKLLFGEEYGLQIASRHLDGTIVTLCLPYGGGDSHVQSITGG